MNKKTIRDVNLKGKRVLVRVDFNVPVENGKVTDDTRITAAVPTLKAILEQYPRSIALMSHFGRPKGGPDPKYSMKPLVPVLEAALGTKVAWADDCAGQAAEKAVAALPDGGVILLENTRFHPEETKNDYKLAEQMAKLGDVFVNDAFGSAHRAHSSTEGVARFLPAVAGLLMEREIEYLGSTLDKPKKPFAAIMGGAKISDKIGVIEHLLTKADTILIGGAMANTFFKAQWISVGKSLVEDEAVITARSLLVKWGNRLVLPVDAVIAEKADANAATQTIRVSDGVPDGWMILDIGPESIELFNKHLDEANTIVWNGPMGMFEVVPFSVGTFAIAEKCAERAQQRAVVIIGGGDSAAAISEAGLFDKVTHVSTGGGASLEMLEGKTLPGLAALNNK